MTIITLPWWKPTTDSIAETAEHAAGLALSAYKASLSAENSDVEIDKVTMTDLDNNHEFYGAIETGWGEVEIDEDETLPFDLNVSLALLNIAGFEWVKWDTDGGFVIALQQSGTYNRNKSFREAYMDSSVSLQKLLFNESAYVQKTLMSILELAVTKYQISRSDSQQPHIFTLEFTAL